MAVRALGLSNSAQASWTADQSHRQPLQRRSSAGLRGLYTGSGLGSARYTQRFSANAAQVLCRSLQEKSAQDAVSKNAEYIASGQPDSATSDVASMTENQRQAGIARPVVHENTSEASCSNNETFLQRLLEQHEARLALRLEKTLRDRLDRSGPLQQQLGAARQQLGQVEGELAALRKLAAASARKAAGLQEQLQQRDDQLKARDCLVVDLQEQLQDKDVLLEGLREGLMDAEHERVDAMAAIQRGLEAERQERQGKMEALRRQLEEEQGLVLELQESLNAERQEREDQVKALRQELEEEQGRFASLHKLLEERDTRIQEMDAKADALQKLHESDVVVLRGQLQEKRDQVAALQKELEEVRRQQPQQSQQSGNSSASGEGSDDSSSSSSAAPSSAFYGVGYAAHVRAQFSDKAVITEKLVKALRAGDADLAIKLVKAGANVNFAFLIEESFALVPYSYKVYPLHFAAWKRMTEVCSALLEAGADLHARCHYGATPLHMVARNGNYETMELLLQKGAEVHARDDDGDTPLHDAAWRANMKLVELLLSYGAPKEAKNKNGETPLDKVRPKLMSTDRVRAMLSGYH